MSRFFEMTYFLGHMRFKDDFQSVLCSLLTIIIFFSLDWMRIDVIRNEPHTSFFEGFQIIFPTASLMFTAAKLKSSDMTKNKPYSLASIMVVDMKLWIYSISVVVKCYSLWGSSNTLKNVNKLSRAQSARGKSSFNVSVLFTVVYVLDIIHN